MIIAVTGTPGSGKTARVVQYELLGALQKGPRRGPSWKRPQIATNVALRERWAETLAGSYRFGGAARRSWRIFDYKSRLMRFTDFGDLADIGLACDKCGATDEECGHSRKEGRGICIFDESSSPLNSRTWDIDANGGGKKEAVLYRVRLIDFLKQHRKAGWDVYLITQDLKFLDSQIREMVEYEIVVRNLKKMRILGMPVEKITGNLFISVKAWEAGPRKKLGVRMIHGRNIYRLRSITKKLYDTHGKSHDLASRPARHWLPRAELLAVEAGASEPRNEAAALPSSVQRVIDQRREPEALDRRPEGL